MNLQDVRGGMRVKVTKRGDETLDQKYMGRVGWVYGFDPFECGASESDPMVMVRFPGGAQDGFWLEELEVAP